MNNFIVMHYGEIGLKGKNRSYFTRMLSLNIRTKCGKLIKSCDVESGQIVAEIEGSEEKLKAIISKIPGIVYFSFAKKCGLELDEIKKEVVAFLKDKKFSTFKVDTDRHSKVTKLNSMELNKIIGQEIVDIYHKKVKLNEPDITIKVEISNEDAYISSEEIEGVGGMPTNPKQKVVSLLSGGFDSAVASYLMMKRGCEVILVHFQNQNQMACAVEDKIMQLAMQLSKYQVHTKLYIVPFEKIQKEIIMKVNSTLRMLIYRRFMIKIASKIANENDAKFLVVGDSLSQVASQTFENLDATYRNSDLHIFSPLIGLDKDEIIAISRKIDTYDISALPYGDCCSYFLAQHPELKGNKINLNEIESEIDGLLVDDAVKEARIKDFS